MKREELDAIRKRAEAATPGPWFNNGEHVATAEGVRGGYPPSKASVCETFDGEYIENENGEADAEFIANARQDVPALLAEVERLQRTVTIYEQALKEIEEHNEYYSGNIADKAITEALRND